MPTRRTVLASTLVVASAVPAVLAAHALASPTDGFYGFLTELKDEARRAGIRPATLEKAFAGVAPNQKVLDRDRHQPEFTMTWARYRALVITDKRIIDGRQAIAANRALFQQVQQRYGVSLGVIAGIWGLESSFGTGTGDYRVVEALATLAWDGRRASFFRGELIAALKILDHGDVDPVAMTGSYAGAMGQPQFMPSSYLRYAVDFEGHGRRDIWTSKPDVLGIDRQLPRPVGLAQWRNLGPAGHRLTRTGSRRTRQQTPVIRLVPSGVRPANGRWAASGDTPAGLVAPDGAGTEAFVVFNNFNAIRRYNPSDFYAIAVGLIGDQVLA